MIIVPGEFPPIIDEIKVVFPAATTTPGVIFSWGEKCYNPSGIVITPALKAHEAVHGHRQGKTEETIVSWWRKYLTDPAFKLEEEILGHRAEFKAYCGYTKDRNQRARMFETVSRRLSGPLYGHAISYQEARRRLV